MPLKYREIAPVALLSVNAAELYTVTTLVCRQKLTSDASISTPPVVCNVSSLDDRNCNNPVMAFHSSVQ